MFSVYYCNGPVYQNGTFHNSSVTVEDGVITAVGAPNDKDLPVGDLHGRSMVPGFLDIHTHGGAGVDINAADVEGLQKISRFFAAHGTTGWLASILTDTEEQTLRSIAHVVAMMEQESEGARLLGIHLEGPFLAAEYKGAMPEHLLRGADGKLFETYRKAAKGNLRYITVSPEVPGVPELISAMRSKDVTVAIGHSGADYETAMKCIENGAAASTHTFNAMKLLHQHFPAIMGAVLESDIYCEAICDGRHLHPGVVRLLLKTKGYDRVVAVTDSIMAAGLPDGLYKLGVNDVEVIDGDARLAGGGSRAGSTLTTGTALKNLVKFTGQPVEKVLPLLTANPAALLGVKTKGAIAPGMDADLVVLEENLDISATIVGGRAVYHRPA